MTIEKAYIAESVRILIEGEIVEVIALDGRIVKNYVSSVGGKTAHICNVSSGFKHRRLVPVTVSEKTQIFVNQMNVAWLRKLGKDGAYKSMTGRLPGGAEITKLLYRKWVCRVRELGYSM